MASEPQVDLTKANPMEFAVKDEPWTKYKLEDGTMLFGRLIIFKIFKGEDYDSTGQPVYAWSSQNLFTTICPKTLKGTPTNPPPTSLDPTNVNTTPVDFERVGSEKWNVYEISDGSLIRAKLEVTGILRTDKFGPDGEPLYVVTSPMIPRIRVPPGLIKKQQLQRQERDHKGLYG